MRTFHNAPPLFIINFSYSSCLTGSNKAKSYLTKIDVDYRLRIVLIKALSFSGRSSSRCPRGAFEKSRSIILSGRTGSPKSRKIVPLFKAVIFLEDGNFGVKECGFSSSADVLRSWRHQKDFETSGPTRIK
ncbi:hypothetical protein CEXT_628061 [Caerostris extrusa]|uniref:Uncharacterized protein n=1 Tax=Caerostris extrusa TaxID=172846 RepID=A0AAV4UQ20_CAEEX|nr:hypothetical protein CEXT_628061 [Caerostris extrusa]